MEIVEVNQREFCTILPDPYNVFGSGSFAYLNRFKAESIHYLLFKEGKYRLGLTGGIRQNTLFSPFSAPYGGFVFLSKDVKISHIDDAIDALIQWAKNHGLKSILLTLPPTIYQESFISKQVNSLFRKRFTLSIIDLNYSFNTENFTELYNNNIWRNAIKNLKIALKNNLNFYLCQSIEEKRSAYEVIKSNREARGFPLQMTWEQVAETSRLIPSDFFICSDEQKNLIASAIVFHVSTSIVQVIYWGDIPAFSHLKTMNFMAYKVFEYYKNIGIQIIDIGPSTENSIPNHGLCEFKESIGCEITQKLTFIKQI
jgi:hypothetical protein